MNNIKTCFTIKDLENLSGIKAHTIRIWEKRYSLLNPNRTGTNIRNYDLGDLQKLLNISYLNVNGYKISKIADLNNEEINTLVKDISFNGEGQNNALNSFKLSMINFDQKLFYDTFEDLSKTKSFEEIFEDVIVPLLNDIGLLWQTDTITPANEHFICTLIQQKLQVNIERMQSKLKCTKSEVYVLFLPLNEIHELGLMYLNYVLLSLGNQTIYLGQSVPVDSLADVQKYYDTIKFVSYFTVKPEKAEVLDYISCFNDTLLKNTNHKLYLLGKKLTEVSLCNLPKHVIPFNSIKDVREYIVANESNKQLSAQHV